MFAVIVAHNLIMLDRKPSKHLPGHTPWPTPNPRPTQIKHTYTSHTLSAPKSVYITHLDAKSYELGTHRAHAKTTRLLGATPRICTPSTHSSPHVLHPKSQSLTTYFTVAHTANASRGHASQSPSTNTCHMYASHRCKFPQ